jgi:glycosyltransferase involved in cell wall biosynthesis
MKIMSKNPLVSIVMNCYNGERYLIDSLTSIFKQTYKNFELIFFDNNSKDGSKSILNTFKDKRIKYYRSVNNAKLYYARNLALKKCSGEIITFLDVDDIWEEKKLEIQVNFFKNNENCDFIYTDYWIFGEKYKYKKKITLNKKNYLSITNSLLKNYDIGLLTIAFKSSIFDKYPIRFNNNYTIIGDFDFVLNLSKFCTFCHIGIPLAKYRVHDESETSKNFSKMIIELKEWYKEKKNQESFNQYKNFKNFNQKITYYEGIYSLMTGNKFLFIKSIKNLKFGGYKIRLILRKIKSLYK